jgi:hypothetical protein
MANIDSCAKTKIDLSQSQYNYLQNRGYIQTYVRCKRINLEKNTEVNDVTNLKADRVEHCSRLLVLLDLILDNHLGTISIY